jgi:DNA-binding transcriptional ArsR family regulator
MQLHGHGHAPERLNATFAALADPTRRAILAKLLTGDATVLQLAEPFDMSQPAISKHLKVLERAGLVSRSREAQTRPVRVERKPLEEASQWLDLYRRQLDARFARLDSVLNDLKAAERPRKRKAKR